MANYLLQVAYKYLREESLPSLTKRYKCIRTEI